MTKTLALSNLSLSLSLSPWPRFSGFLSIKILTLLCTKAGELVARKLESGHELHIFVKLNHSTSASLQKEKSSTKSFACTYGWLVGEAQLIHSFKQKSNL
jgi:hypothetical protein